MGKKSEKFHPRSVTAAKKLKTDYMTYCKLASKVNFNINCSAQEKLTTYC